MEAQGRDETDRCIKLLELNGWQEEDSNGGDAVYFVNCRDDSVLFIDGWINISGGLRIFPDYEVFVKTMLEAGLLPENYTPVSEESMIFEEFLAAIKRDTGYKHLKAFPTDPIRAAAIVQAESGWVLTTALEYVYEDKVKRRMLEAAYQLGAMVIKFIKNFYDYDRTEK